MREHTNLRSDLIIAFGFPKANAEKALEMYDNGQLSEEETKVLDYLEQKDPFTTAMGKREGPTLRKGTIPTLEHLNYKITIGT